MKKKKIAFTMIELIVVISIISIISITSITGFFNFLEDKQIKIKMNEVIIYIDYLDKKIKNHEIYDYKMEFRDDLKDSFIVSENIFDNNKYTHLDYNSLTNSGTINLNQLSGESWYLSIYKDKKLIYNNTILNTSFEKNDFENNYNYKILSTLSGSNNINKLNSIDLIRIDKEEKIIDLFKISSSLGGSNIGKLELVNIGGKKEFYNSGALINTNDIYLYFESKGRENYLKITK